MGGKEIVGEPGQQHPNFAQKINAFIPRDDHDTRQWFIRVISNLAMSLKNHLQEKVTIRDLDSPGEEVEKLSQNRGHLPNKFSTTLYEKVNQLYMSKAITGEQFFLLDKEMKEFADIVGGCERIRNTPIPYSYAMYIKKFIFVYIITLPLAL